ncbi:MAG: BolA family transcriptional regulator [Gammaproteobacteria bacterium]|nr:MAG: BolA family transcriptional regulator [Gammaproteobacteria bacterium]
MSETTQKLKNCLTSALSPVTLDIQDDSALHAGHAGNTGGGHYSIVIISKFFEGLPLIKRHKLVYEAAADLMKTEIHALSIQAKTPSEN